MISIVVAMTNNRVIGYNQQMPWYLPADLAHFKKITWGKPIIMGRKTYDSIGRPLPGRRNIVITRQSLSLAGCVVSHSLEAALAEVAEVAEVMIIGGGHLYRQALPLAQRLYITIIDCEVKGDTFFPPWQADDWQSIADEAHSADSKNAYPYRFLTLQRR